MAEWVVQIGRFDIRFTLTSLNRFLSDPKNGHVSWLVNIFVYLKSVTGRRKSIVILPEDIEEISVKGDNVKDWLEQYPDTSEDICEGITDPRGRPFITSVYFYSGHSHDKVTR